MGESKISILALVVMGAMVACAVVWFGIDRVTPELWAWRIGLLFLLMGSLTLLLWAMFRRGLVPEFLRHLRGTMFNKGGVCFKVAPAVIADTAYVSIAFENRYAGPCEFRVMVSAPPKFFSAGTEHFPGVDVIVPCAGGMLGIIQAPIGIPARFQKKKIKFRLFAQTRYVGRTGKLLRFRGGKAVGDPDASKLAPALFSLAWLLTGHIHIHVKSDAGVSIIFPGPVAEEVSPDAEPTVETLWLPGDPEDGVLDRLKQAMDGR